MDSSSEASPSNEPDGLSDSSSDHIGFDRSIANKCKVTSSKKKSLFDTEESSSSSDDYEKAPLCLDDLDRLELKSIGTSRKIFGNVQRLPLNVEMRDSIAGGESSRTDDAVEYYDFSSILKSQEELKAVALQMEKYAIEHETVQSSSAVNTKKICKVRKTSKKTTVGGPTNANEIDDLLRMGESANKQAILQDNTVDDEMIAVPSEEHSDDDQEPPQDVEITIAHPSAHLKKKRSKDLMNLIELARKHNESRRLFQIDLHKVTLLGWLAHGFTLNTLANNDMLQALALSITTSKNLYPPGSTTVSYIERITKWFNKHFSLDNAITNISLDSLIENFEKGRASNLSSLIVMFVAWCRQLGLKCRLLISLQPCSVRPPQSDTIRIPKAVGGDDEDEPTTEKSPKKRKTKAPSKKAPDTKKTKVTNNATGKKKTEGKGKKVTSKPPNRKVLSTDSSEDELTAKAASTKKGVDLWAEVYCEVENSWIPADVARAQVNNASAVGSGLTKPVSHVIAWNSDGTIKELTRRYCQQWKTKAARLQNNDGWKRVLQVWAPPNTKLEKLENHNLDSAELAQPIPSTINECKNHPFYALKRHLLKFEGIYPPDAVPIGYIRSEPVYSRVCVVELHTKETWMRQGKAVKVNEEPYKIVKARPKYDKVSQTVIKDLPLPLFGHWQVVDYTAPPAVDGVVPKNAYGNVELYKPSMLPAGTVHLQVPGIARIAKKLTIDCAPAVVGWEFHGGSSHPCIDGIVVCEEFQDTLLDAWNTTIDEENKKDRMKSKMRARKNWRKLMRALVIRKRLETLHNLDLSSVQKR